MGGRDPAAFIAPGFRFHPTDEELVKFYLKRKVCGKAFRFDAIANADVYKCEPWDLPDKAALKSRDLEWYFFSVLDKKYGHGSKTNRATLKGYWKTTGKDRPIHNNSVLVGLKKTLVYHIGRAPRGERTNWVMHEYRLADTELEKAGVAQASFVLCRIFQKSGQGPKNGEQHGAPFIEEEWEDVEEVLVTGGLAENEALIADGAYLETDDLDQLIDFNVSPERNPIQGDYYHGDTSNSNVDPRIFSEDALKPFIANHGNVNYSNHLMPDQQSIDELKPNEMQGNLVESFAKPDETVSEEVNYLLEEPHLDGNFDDVHNADLFLEIDDLLDPIDGDPACFDMLHEYLADFDANDDIFYMPPDNSVAATETHLPQETHIFQKQPSEEQKSLMLMEPQEIAKVHNSNAASSSNRKCTNIDSGSKSSIVKHTNRMLESIPAPPAFAAEFPTKEAALQLALAMQSQNPINVTANSIHARNTITTNNGLSWSFDKNGNVQLVFSLSVAQGIKRLDSATMDINLSSRKRSANPRIWLYLILFWISILYVSMKLASTPSSTIQSSMAAPPY